jgi:hypothetical protein
MLVFALKYWRVWLVLAALAALSGWAVRERFKLLSEGRQQELTKIEDANNVSRKEADKGSETVEQCFDDGGAWDRDNGVCEHPSPGR